MEDIFNVDAFKFNKEKQLFNIKLVLVVYEISKSDIFIVNKLIQLLNIYSIVFSASEPLKFDKSIDTNDLQSLNIYE